jgi:UDPglucose 6-dehydrogenase
MVSAENIRRDVLGDKVDARLSVAMSVDEAVAGANAIAIVTEWDEFKKLDYTKIFKAMAKPALIFDGRNILDLEQLRAMGFRVHGIGK